MNGAATLAGIAAMPAARPAASPVAPAAGTQLQNSRGSDQQQKTGGTFSLDPQQKRTEQSRGVQRALGGILAVLMRSPGHRHLTVADLESIVAPAVATGQFLLAESTNDETGFTKPVAFLLWASFSAAIDARLTAAPEQPFPSKPADCKSGDIVWVVDAAGDQALIGQMIQQQKAATWKGKMVRMRVAGEGGCIAVNTLMERQAT